MNTATRVGAFGAGVALTFGAAFGVGQLVGPIGEEPRPSHDAHGGDGDGGGDGAGHGGHEGPAAPGGLQISERGYTLVPPTEPLTAGERTDLTFRIEGPGGEPLTAYRTSHEKELHLIVVRRDLTGFQHVHPERGPDGTWSVPITLEGAGAYRMFADFLPEGEESGLTLGADLAVAGEHTPEPLPEPAATDTVDGYTVALAAEGPVRAGAEAALTLTVSRDGEPVTDLEPYLGAYGHLVALRAGDLGYLHVHPQGEPGDGVTPAGPGITFHTTVPSEGTYRLYLDFQHGGEVRTAEFTLRVGAADHDDPDHDDPDHDDPEHDDPEQDDAEHGTDTAHETDDAEHRH
ncbi:hypothetical protein [Streptomyces triticirhizae]|uniref:hypothetical protein n=1 Tax=Streptomyces triticirhizae TaxID=2483353 RepID=UPI001315328C|nr:hypothetical protein [Streptomyces triticirhizae]